MKQIENSKDEIQKKKDELDIKIDNETKRAALLEELENEFDYKYSYGVNSRAVIFMNIMGNNYHMSDAILGYRNMLATKQNPCPHGTHI